MKAPTRKDLTGENVAFCPVDLKLTALIKIETQSKAGVVAQTCNLSL